jgi:hypothetical protein
MASDDDNKQNINVLVGVTGSVAAIKLPILIEKLLEIPQVCLQLFTLKLPPYFTFYSCDTRKANVIGCSKKWNVFIGSSNLMLIG